MWTEELLTAMHIFCCCFSRCLAPTRVISEGRGRLSGVERKRRKPANKKSMALRHKQPPPTTNFTNTSPMHGVNYCVMRQVYSNTRVLRALRPTG